MANACAVHHPLSPELALPDVLAGAVSFMAHQGFHVVAKRRAEFFLKWNRRVHELEDAEVVLRRGMDNTVERAVRGKRIALFADMLELYDYPDKSVVEELSVGASLTGEMVETGMLPFKLRQQY